MWTESTSSDLALRTSVIAPTIGYHVVDYVNDPHRVKARKEHRCDWCGQKIEAGEEYTVSTLVGDCIYDWHECDRCASYVSEFFKETKPIDYGDGISPIYFNAWMEEAHSDVLEDWRAK